MRTDIVHNPNIKQVYTLCVYVYFSLSNCLWAFKIAGPKDRLFPRRNLCVGEQMIILTIHSPVRALFDYCKIAIANNFSNSVFLKKSRWFRALVSIHACKKRINAKSKENVSISSWFLPTCKIIHCSAFIPRSIVKLEKGSEHIFWIAHLNQQLSFDFLGWNQTPAQPINTTNLWNIS